MVGDLLEPRRQPVGVLRSHGGQCPEHDEIEGALQELDAPRVFTGHTSEVDTGFTGMSSEPGFGVRRFGVQGFAFRVLERERDNLRAWRRREQAVAAGGDHHVLPAVSSHERHRRRVRAGVERRFPEQRAGVGVERAEAAVDRAADEHEAAGRRDRAADVRRAGLVEAARFQIVEDAERHAPPDGSHG